MVRTLRYQGNEITLSESRVTGTWVRKAFRIPPERAILLRTDRELRELPEHKEVELPPCAEVVDLPFHEYGSPLAVASRLEEEARCLSSRYGQTVRYGFDPDLRMWWVHLPQLSLPNGWSHKTSPALVLVEDDYPFSPPDGFFLRADLTDRFGRRPGHYYGATARYPTLWRAGYGWFCLYVKRWTPGATPLHGDSLYKFFALIETALKRVAR
jgi:hypothetical protein